MTGEELICEVLDEAPDSIAVRNAFVLSEKETTDGYKYFAFRTFMTYQDTPLSVMMLMTDKVVGIAIPSVDMMQQFNTALDELADHLAQWAEEDVDTPPAKPKPKVRNNNVMSIEDWLREDVDNPSLLDSDTTGLIPN